MPLPPFPPRVLVRPALFVLAVAAAGCAGPRPSPGAASALDTLRTRAERTDFRETSRYADVAAFLDAVRRANPDVRLTTFGTTNEGRALPLAVWGAPGTSAAAVRATGKTRVFVFANIHGGEVDGKEAMLALLRDLARGRHAAWADSLVLMVAPLYNADGNERVALDNRPLQLGPVGGMGQRPNAQGLDLNRDFVKADAPETRAMLRLLRAYDPHVVLDLHTTDGTAMAYALTYAPPLHPNTDRALDAEAWDRWLPEVTRAVGEDGWRMWHYGNIPGAFGEPATAPRGWYSFDYRPRFGITYTGLRNRFGFLSESYSYEPFERRVGASRAFVEAVVDYAARNATRVRRMTEAADRASVVGQTLALTARFEALPEPHEVLLSPVDTVRHSVTGAPMLRTTGEVVRERMPAFVRFAPALQERAPAAYLVPAGMTELLALLDRHGVRHEPFELPPGRPVEVFGLDSVRVAERPFQGHRLQEAFGAWSTLNDGPGGRYVRVPVDQPLGRLVFTLLEPRSDDGAVAWALIPEERLRQGYPVFRLSAP